MSAYFECPVREYQKLLIHSMPLRARVRVRVCMCAACTRAQVVIVCATAPVALSLEQSCSSSSSSSSRGLPQVRSVPVPDSRPGRFGKSDFTMSFVDLTFHLIAAMFVAATVTLSSPFFYLSKPAPTTISRLVIRIIQLLG